MESSQEAEKNSEVKKIDKSDHFQEHLYPAMDIYNKYIKKKLNISDSFDNDYDTIEELWLKQMDS